MSTFHRVATLPQLEGGEIVAVEIAGLEIIVYKVDNEVRACQRYCVHQGADLTEGIVSRGSLLCSAHGWRFDARTGVLDTSPAVCLRTYATRVEGQDVLVDPTPIRNGVQPHD